MRLLLADEDTAYVTMLAKAVRESEWGRKISVSVVTNPAGDWVFEQIGEYDAVIVSPEYQQQFLSESDERFVMLWSEEPEKADVMDQDSLPRIYKYQPVHQLVMEVMEAYSTRRGDRDVIREWRAGDCRVIAVYAASGGLGTTSFARGLSEMLTTTGYRAFYLNMECIPSFPVLGQDSRKFGEVLYHLRRGEAAQLRSLIVRDPEREYDTLPTADYYKQWSEYSSSEIQQLIQFLRELKQYDCLVIDLECSLTEQMIAIVQLCDDLLWLRKDEAISQYKADFVRRELGFIMPDRLDKVCTSVQLNHETASPLPASTYAPYMKLLGFEGKDLLG